MLSGYYLPLPNANQGKPVILDAADKGTRSDRIEG